MLIKIKPKYQKFSRNDIKIVTNKREIKPRIEYSPFDNSKKIVFNLPYHLYQKISLVIKNKITTITVKIGSEIIKINCKYKSFGYIELRINNIKFIRFIDNYAGERRSNKIRLNKFLLDAQKDFIISALSAVIDSEGSIEHYRHTRRVRVRMVNLEYIRGWKKLLKKLGIRSCVSKERHLWGLTITGWTNFNRIQGLGLKLYHSEKRKKFNKVMNSYQKKQILRNTWKEFYINKLDKIGKPISAAEFAKILGKSKRVVNHYLTKLDREDLIKVNKSNVRYLYSTLENR